MRNHKTNFNQSVLPSFWISIFPVILGTCLAFGDGVQHWLLAIISLAIAILLQATLILILNKIPTNLVRTKTFLVGFICGPLMAAGSYYLQSREMNAAVILSGIPLGLLAMTILSLNLQPTMPSERIILRYLLFTFIASLMPVIIYGITGDNIYSLSACAILFMTIKPILKLSHKHTLAYDFLIRSTIRIALTYTILFSVGWIF